MHILILQLNLSWQNPDINRQHIQSSLDRYQGPIDLVLLPEMFTTGFSMEAADLAEPINGPTRAWLENLAWERGCLIGGSLITQVEGEYFNRFWLVGPDGWTRHYDKRHTFRMAHEHLHYTSGQQQVIVNYQGWNLLLLVCYDLRFPVWSRNRYLAQEGRMAYDGILCVANWPAARKAQWDTLLRARAIENQCYVLAANRVGEDGNGVRYAGGSALIDPLGRDLALATEEETGLYGFLDREKLTKYRKKFPVWKDADQFQLITSPPDTP